MSYMTAQDLENEANQLSNFGGGIGYVGHGDDFLEFAGSAASFADAGSEAKPFIVSLTNSGAAARTVLLSPGLIADAVGLMKTGAFNDKSGAAGLSGASGSPGTIEEFNAFIRHFPSLISGFKIASDNVAQMDQSITIVKRSPFKQHASLVIATGTYASEGNFNTKILTVPRPFFMDCQTAIEYIVLPGTSVTLTLMVGTSLNIAKALREKTQRAKQTIAQVGGAAVVRSYIG
ncbi:hypothetical protein Pedsa_0878 [Pseudopedobacter saltans DSM 12145]|uniref:Uncharacterized protein n=2 Tax=Pseudopedobacter saltans TaxID=151895 RepID=F0S9U4_PSESL|nr:hypothetical protein Pedsa_0878 [Pseudopedobacter saltans DSM 12145]